MSTTLLSLLMPCLLGSSGPAGGPPGEDASPPVRIACIGDSIALGTRLRHPATERFPAALGRRLGARYTVRAFAVKGATWVRGGDVPWVTTDAHDAAMSFAPDIVLVLLGTNDSKAGNWVHSAEFDRDAAHLLDRIRSLPSRPRMVLLSPPPVLRDDLKVDEKTLAREVDPAIRRAARSAGLLHLDLRPAFTDHPELYTDGVHPNAAGAERIAELAAEFLRRRVLLRGSGASLVWIRAPGLGAKAIGAYGGATARTPTLDRLAAEGMRFDRAWPARIRARSDPTVARNGSEVAAITDPDDVPDDVPDLVASLRAAGYRTLLATEEEGAGTGAGFDEVVELHGVDATDLPRSGPFFLLVDAVRSPELAGADAVDRIVGRVLATLEARASPVPPCLLFTSAPPPPAKGPVRGEGDQRLACLLRWPSRILPGSVTSSVVSEADLAPTLRALAGAFPDAGAHGRSLLPLVRNPWSDVRRFALTVVVDPGDRVIARLARSRELVYARREAARSTEPGERRESLLRLRGGVVEHGGRADLVDDPGLDRALGEHREALRAWLERGRKAANQGNR